MLNAIRAISNTKFGCVGVRSRKEVGFLSTALLTLTPLFIPKTVSHWRRAKSTTALNQSPVPIVLLDESDFSRDIARRRLNLRSQGVVYVQLGAGRINDIDSEIRLTVEALLKHEDITVVVGESMLEAN